MKITDILNIDKNSIVSIVGAGGKTSLMFQLAEELREKSRVLVTTTTKIYVPEKGQYDYLIVGEEGENCFFRNNEDLIPASSEAPQIKPKGIWV